MKKETILLTGGTGRLGKELQKYIECDAPTRRELDITKPETIKEYEDNYGTIIHCAAYTDVAKAEKEREQCFKANVTGTKNLLNVFPNKKFVYISSEYARDPVNYYSWTKSWGEDLVSKHPNYLIIRTSFKDNPFPHKEAFFDQYTEGDYVDVIAPMVAAEIMKGSTEIAYVGTGRKSIFELARRTRPNIKGISVDDIKDVRLPKDC